MLLARGPRSEQQGVRAWSQGCAVTSWGSVSPQRSGARQRARPDWFSFAAPDWLLLCHVPSPVPIAVVSDWIVSPLPQRL